MKKEPLLIEYKPSFRPRSWLSEYRDIRYLENVIRMKYLDKIEKELELKDNLKPEE